MTGSCTTRTTMSSTRATGTQADLFTLEIWRIENGLIVEHWGGLREYERFREQLG